MKYKQIKITFDYSKPNRFYRTLLVKENINLVDLGCAIVTAFNGTFEHYFLFRKDKKILYLMLSMLKMCDRI